jgi:hypothetical protein
MDPVVREAEVAQTAHEAIGSSFVMLILSVAVAFAQAEPSSTQCPHPLFSDPILMTKARLSDAPIVAHVSARRGHLDSIGAAGTTTVGWAKTMPTPLDAATVDQDPVE